MKVRSLSILSGKPGWHVRDLQRAAQRLGLTTSICDFRTLVGGLGPDRLPFDEADALIVRSMPLGSLEQVVFRMDLLQQAESAGKPILNPPRALEVCIDKYLTGVRLTRAALPMPRTIACQTFDAAMQAWEALGGDVVVKPLFGSEGRGMIRISDPETAWRVFKAVERTQGVLYVQQFIRHPGWDLRVFVVADRVICGMRRFAGGDWRTNVAQGGRGERVEVASAEAMLARAAARAVGTIVAGVDLLPSVDGVWYVLEVNAVPGWRALAPVCGLDIARIVLTEGLLIRQGLAEPLSVSAAPADLRTDDARSVVE